MTTFELPLAFRGHNARIVVVHAGQGPWQVRTEIDDRVLGRDQLTHRVQVDRYRTRMQGWIAQMEAAEQRRVS